MQAEEQVVMRPDMDGGAGVDSKVAPGKGNVGADSQEGQGGTSWTYDVVIFDMVRSRPDSTEYIPNSFF